MLLLLRGNNYTKYMFKIQFCCVLVRYCVFEDKEIDTRIERYVFFSGTYTSQQHNVVLHNTHTLTHTHTRTHAWPTVASRASGSRGFFFGFCKYFLTTSGQQEFFGPPGGHATSENISRVTNVFSCLCLYFYAGIMLQGFVIRI